MRHHPAFPIGAIAASLFVMSLGAGTARAQALTVLPVIIDMTPGQMAAVLTVVDAGNIQTSFQVRPFAWAQTGNSDALRPSKTLLVSPPLGTIQPGARQIIRLVLRRPPVGREATYRILLDQIPPPAAPGTVRIALRLSIPVFAEPATRAAPNLAWRVETAGGQLELTAVNTGNRHETLRDIVLRTKSGAPVPVERGASPYVLAGATRSWRIGAQHPPLASGEMLTLTAGGDSGAINRLVPVVGAR